MIMCTRQKKHKIQIATLVAFFKNEGWGKYLAAQKTSIETMGKRDYLLAALLLAAMAVVLVAFIPSTLSKL